MDASVVTTKLSKRFSFTISPDRMVFMIVGIFRESNLKFVKRTPLATFWLFFLFTNLQMSHTAILAYNSHVNCFSTIRQKHDSAKIMKREKIVAKKFAFTNVQTNKRTLFKIPLITRRKKGLFRMFYAKILLLMTSEELLPHKKIKIKFNRSKTVPCLNTETKLLCCHILSAAKEKIYTLCYNYFNNYHPGIQTHILVCQRQ